ncbi:pyridoxamine 5'-phosphate oxidase family protein [Nocardia sp. CDC153]|uniref:pyridoxamine 5'-phosphate oxidase family protein n=1 Tax=Nocardia sp. CDC153 TaxID=3112167 RepID=UPI002DB6684C|nr:pyridoxamine 5'-phosphate oxidase family protein [Nocardia sp. CDC153]MEC3953733.1 pyridoxamine 5'-phosphate oxidase family protein [Nocardia sp. CDC153]
MNPRPDIRDLPVDTAMWLLGSVKYGRIVFSRYALPVIRPADHIVDDSQIIIRTDVGISFSPDSQAVAYEADSIDPNTRRGWCVIVTGIAETITEPDELARLQPLLSPGIAGPHGRILRIRPDIVTGIEIFTPQQPETLLTRNT